MIATDQRGERLTKSVRRWGSNWAATVWFGNQAATTVRTYVYRTRREARNADISDQNAIQILEGVRRGN